MCIFSGDIESVSNTRIFARHDGDRQVLAYSMSFAASDELAMVLPLPVALHSGDDAAAFIPLDDYDEFFDHLDALFPQQQSYSTLGYSARSAPLQVHSVGAFEASYSPNVASLDRLDPRFRVAPEIWQQLPQFADFGFAVFKLKPGQQKPHPMAFSFPLRDPSTLFFPTVHVHQGRVDETADFDHTLFCQLPASGATPDAETWWQGSGQNAFDTMVSASHGVLRQAPVYRTTLEGPHPNEDVILSFPPA